MQFLDNIKHYFPNDDPKILLNLINQIENSFDEFCKTFCIIMDSENEDEVVNALTLAMDIVIQPNVKKHELKVIKLLFESDVIKAIRSAISRKEVNIRNQAIYTLGKIGDVKSSQIIRNLLGLAIDKDPLILSSILFEYNWLTNSRELKNMIDIFLKSNHVCVRWILLEYLNSCDYGRRTKRHFIKLQAIDKLARSPEYFIADEAQYVRREMLHKKKGDLMKELENISSGKYKKYKGPFYYSIQGEYVKLLKETGYANYGSEDYSNFIRKRLSRKTRKSDGK